MNERKAVTSYFEPALQAVSFCRKTRVLALWGLLVCTLGQVFIESTLLNTTCVLIVSTVSAITFHWIIRGSVFRAAPLPALVVLGFNISTMSGAIFAQTFSFRSLVYNLKVPEITFSLCAIFQFSILIALNIFLRAKSFVFISRNINRAFLRIGVMSAPSPLQIWMIGLIGSFAMLWVASNSYSGYIQYGDVGSKFISGFLYLAFAPFLLPILDKFYPSSSYKRQSKYQKWFLIGYMVFLIFIAMVRNNRGTFMMGITNLAVACFLLLLLGQLRLSIKFKKVLVAGSLVALIAAPVAADLAIAMVVVRGERSQVSSQELVKKTIAAFNDKPALENYRRLTNFIVNGSDYDENYISNPFLARFVNTKFFDNSLSYPSVSAGRHADKIWSITVDKIVATLPTPVLKAMAVNVKKENLEFSMGDALYNAQSGTGLGGYRTGSPIGHGVAILGYWIFVVAIPIFLISFIGLQSLIVSVGSLVIISPVILLQLMQVFGLAAGDSLLSPVGLILRSLPESILIYWLVFM